MQNSKDCCSFLLFRIIYLTFALGRNFRGMSQMSMLEKNYHFTLSSVCYMFNNCCLDFELTTDNKSVPQKIKTSLGQRY